MYIYFPLYLQPVVDEPGCVSIAKGDPIEIQASEGAMEIEVHSVCC